MFVYPDAMLDFPRSRFPRLDKSLLDHCPIVYDRELRD